MAHHWTNARRVLDYWYGMSHEETAASLDIVDCLIMPEPTKKPQELSLILRYKTCSMSTTYHINSCPINPKSATLDEINFHPFEVVGRYSDPQLQVGENYSYLFNLRPNICKSWCLHIILCSHRLRLNGDKTDKNDSSLA